MTGYLDLKINIKEEPVQMDQRNDKSKVVEILESAIRSEIDGYNFYLWASLKTKDPKGKTVFRELAEEEIRHLRMLEDEYKRYGGVKSWREPEPKEVNKKKTFEINSRIKMKVSEGTSAEDAFKLALRIEEDAEEFYREIAEKTKGQAIHKALLDLADMEKKHHELIRCHYEQAASSGG